MLVDGGPPDCWASALLPRLERLPPDERRIDLVVVSHVDSDHIGGLLPFFRDGGLGLDIGDVWFNGRPHVAGGATRGTRSLAQGEQLTSELLGEGPGPPYPWNVALAGGPVSTYEQGDFVEVPLVGGAPRLTLLSPTRKRLAFLGRRWDEYLDRAREGDADEVEPPPPLALGNLLELAAAPASTDSSVPNGSSIAVLLEHRGVSCVLGADALGSVLGAALAGVARHRGLPFLTVDALKLPHHGSRNNIPRALTRVVNARHWMISSNGDRFGHPDDIALARVVIGATPGSTLWFNYRNERTTRWADPGLRREFGYDVRYPAVSRLGSVLEMEARE
jgi:hypothetical protein